MRRSHRLSPVLISHLETHHAYISPPLPEKGGLPTIVVTPAEPASAQDFQIHFYSPKATQQSFPESSFSFLSFKSYFGTPQDQDQGDMKERSIWSPLSHTQNGDYVALPTEDHDDEAGHVEWNSSSSSKASGFLKRRARALVLLSIPFAIVTFHCVAHKLGYMTDADAIWGDVTPNGETNPGL